MDSTNYYSIQKSALLRHILIFLLLSAIVVCAQDKSDTKYDLPQNAIDSYLLGAQSDNYGLKTSCIYFIGKYRILEANSKLIEEIGNTEDEDLRILIAWSLYRIGEDSGLEKLESLSLNSDSQQLKAFCANLHDIKMLESELNQVYVRLPNSKYYSN